MTADAPPRLPVPVSAPPLSRRRVELTIARATAGFGLAFLAQALLALVPQAANLHPLWVWTVAPALVAALMLLGAATLVGWRKSAAAMVFAFVYLAALLSWPFAVLDPALAAQDSFWLYFVLTLATMTAVIAFPLRWATLYLVGAPLLYGLIRVTPPGGGVPVDLAALDSIYSIVLGGFIAILSTVLRDAAREVDAARAAALTRYTSAVRHHATDAERIEVDALVHDTVLTTFISAARAETSESRALVTRMAESAIQRLRDALASVAPDTADRVSAAALAARVRASAAALGEPVTVQALALEDRPIPRAVGEALHSAAMQALLNSVQHAGPAVRWVRLQGRPADGGIEIEIADTGVGFDLEQVPTARIGVRVSILERLAAVGGRAEISSAPGAGTRVLLSWPDLRAPAAPGLDQFAAEAGEAGEPT